jgi:GPH family glycoside/pentoside/hexuronide:cation symporter
MFVRIPGLSQTGYFIYATVTYIIFGMLYTGVNIPYGSLAQVVTGNEREAFLAVDIPLDRLDLRRNAGDAACKLLLRQDRRRYSAYVVQQNIVGVVIIAVLSVAACMLCYAWTKERIVTAPAPKQSRHETLRLFGIFAKSRPYVVICIVGMLFLAAQMFGQSYYTYLFNYYFRAPALSMMPTVCQYLPVAVIMLSPAELAQNSAKKSFAAGECFRGRLQPRALSYEYLERCDLPSCMPAQRHRQRLHFSAYLGAGDRRHRL